MTTADIDRAFERLADVHGIEDYDTICAEIGLTDELRQAVFANVVTPEVFLGFTAALLATSYANR